VYWCTGRWGVPCTFACAGTATVGGQVRTTMESMSYGYTTSHTSTLRSHYLVRTLRIE
jgi:hypothetical protein